MKILIQYKLKQILLRCIITDGVRNTCGSERGLVEQIHKLVKKLDVKFCGYSQYYSSAGTWWKMFESKLMFLN